MSEAAKQFNFDTDSEDPRNRLLDAFETQIDALVEQGLETQVVARLKRKFPELGAEKSAPAPGIAGRLGLDNLQLAALLTDLKRVSKLRMDGATHSAVSRLRELVAADLAEVSKSLKKGDVQ